MTNDELIKRLISLSAKAEIFAEFAELGEGGNVKSSVTDVVIEDGKIVLITEHAL